MSTSTGIYLAAVTIAVGLAAGLPDGARLLFSGAGSATERSNLGSLKSLVQSVKLEAERNAIAAALDKTGWNRKAAARLLKVSYRTLLYKIEQYDMHASDAVPFAGEKVSKANGNGFKGGSRVS